MCSSNGFTKVSRNSSIVLVVLSVVVMVLRRLVVVIALCCSGAGTKITGSMKLVIVMLYSLSVVTVVTGLQSL